MMKVKAKLIGITRAVVVVVVAVVIECTFSFPTGSKVLVSQMSQ